MVLDADGLNAHAGRLRDLAGRLAPAVLTPHEGELARLLETESAAVQARRLHHAREAAAASGCVVVLKGDDTLVARPDGVVGVSRGGSPGLATAGTGDVLSGVLGAMLAKRVEPVRGRLRRGPRARGRGRGSRPSRRVPTVSSPATSSRRCPRRSRASGRRASEPCRCARWRGWTWRAVERNCARMAAGLQRGARLGAVVKADGYGHGAAAAARAALAGGASWLAVATAWEAADLRAAGVTARILVMGALSAEELDVALAADADVVAWREAFVAALAARGGARVHVKLDTGMGRLGTRDPGEADRVAAAVAAAPGLELVGAMTHFATADEPGDALLRGAARALSRRGWSRSGTLIPGCSPMPPTARPRCATRAPTSTWCGAGSRSTAWIPSIPTPTPTASSRPWCWSPTSPTSSRARRGEHRLRPPLRRRAPDPPGRAAHRLRGRGPSRALRQRARSSSAAPVTRWWER